MNIGQFAGARLRGRFYHWLASYPRASSLVRARRYDKREFIREWLGLRNERELLRRVRGGRDVCWIESDDQGQPLVTVAIPTFRRPDHVVRAVQSALSQTYRNIEVLVVGDKTDDETADALGRIHDPRLRYVNLGHQGLYPDNNRLRGTVSGSKPMNVAIDLARGEWLACCDDDDEMLPNSIEVLLNEAISRRLELVYSRFESVDHAPSELPANTAPRVSVGGAEPFRMGSVARGTVIYSMGLNFMRYEIECWRIRDPHDWNLWKRMQLIGVRIGFCEEVTYRYHQYPQMTDRPLNWWTSEG